MRRAARRWAPVVCARLMGLALLTGLAAGATPPAAQPTLLVIYRDQQPMVTQLVEAFRGRPQLRGFGLEIHRVTPGASPAQTAEMIAPGLSRYAAVFAPSIALAREVQMRHASVPIVFLGADDPVRSCLVDSLRRPGRNATGIVNYLPNEDDKLLETLKRAYPALTRVVYLAAGENYFPGLCNAPPQGQEEPPCRAGLRQPDAYLRELADADRIDERARSLGMAAQFVVVCDRADVERLASLLPVAANTGVVVVWQTLFGNHGTELVSQIALSGLPAIFARRSFLDLGGVLALEPLWDADDGQRLVDIVAQVLAGRSPAALPVQQPRGFRISVHAGNAVRRNLRPSIELMRRADDIVLDSGLGPAGAGRTR